MNKIDFIFEIRKIPLNDDLREINVEVQEGTIIKVNHKNLEESSKEISKYTTENWKEIENDLLIILRNIGNVSMNINVSFIPSIALYYRTLK